MIRVATFNVENLFARYDFRKNIEPETLDGFSVNNIAFTFYDEIAKDLTAKTIKAIDADILALQEVENLTVLDRFNSIFLKGKGYKHRLLIDAFDPRKIDVALLSRYPIVHVRSYRQERNSRNTGFMFSRDCLEVDLNVDGKILKVYINHFKSMVGGRNRTKAKREEQVNRVSEIVDAQWKDKNYEGNFIVLGDFNDYVGKDTSLEGLVANPNLVDVARRIPEEDRWTHFWARGKKYNQLDYMLLSRSLAEANCEAPQIFRGGLPYRAEKYDGERFEYVGVNSPKASDHCPLYMDIELN